MISHPKSLTTELFIQELVQANNRGKNQNSTLQPHDDGILPKGPYPPCLRMADRALLAGYPVTNGPVMQKMFPCHNVVMYNSLGILSLDDISDPPTYTHNSSQALPTQLIPVISLSSAPHNQIQNWIAAYKESIIELLCQRWSSNIAYSYSLQYRITSFGLRLVVIWQPTNWLLFSEWKI